MILEKYLTGEERIKIKTEKRKQKTEENRKEKKKEKVKIKNKKRKKMVKFSRDFDQVASMSTLDGDNFLLTVQRVTSYTSFSDKHDQKKSYTRLYISCTVISMANTDSGRISKFNNGRIVRQGPDSGGR